MDEARAPAGEDPTPAEDPIAASVAIDEPAPAISEPEEAQVEKPAAELPHADVDGVSAGVDDEAVAAPAVAAAEVDTSKHAETDADAAEQQEQGEQHEMEQGPPGEAADEQHGEEAQQHGEEAPQQQGDEVQQQGQRQQRQPEPDYGPEEWETMEICEEWLPCPIVRVSLHARCRSGGQASRHACGRGYPAGWPDILV